MRGVIVVCLLAAAAPSHAEDVFDEDAPSRHMLYVELLGKGGLYGVGYEYAVAEWLGFGGAGSYSLLRDQHVLTLSPYLHFTIVGERHALFSEVGAIFAHTRVASPVMNWDGISDSGGGGYAALGWEHKRRHVVLRTSGAIAFGEGGLAPMLGFSIGARR
jgi:hypothetical protein